MQKGANGKGGSSSQEDFVVSENPAVAIINGKSFTDLSGTIETADSGTVRVIRVYPLSQIGKRCGLPDQDGTLVQSFLGGIDKDIKKAQFDQSQSRGRHMFIDGLNLKITPESIVYANYVSIELGAPAKFTIPASLFL